MKLFSAIAAGAVVGTSFFACVGPSNAEIISTNCVFRDDVRITRSVKQCRIKVNSTGHAESISWPTGDGGWRTARAEEHGWFSYGYSTLQNDDGRWIYPE